MRAVLSHGAGLRIRESAATGCSGRRWRKKLISDRDAMTKVTGEQGFMQLMKTKSEEVEKWEIEVGYWK